MIVIEPGTKSLVTPEGIPLRFAIAPFADRLVAFALDLLLVGILIVAVVVVVGLPGGAAWATGIALLAVFLLRDLYFVFFEIRRQGATPGKRILGIRVIDRRGGTLSATSVFTRNITREFELFLPIVLLSAPERLAAGAPGWATASAVLWIVLVMLFPFFNREHLRIGDLVAGTLVVKAPRALLLADLVERRGRPRPAAHEFTPEQLDIYGIYELQVLEDLLRERGSENLRTRREVAKKIARKIGWRGRVRDVDRFLSDFYAAQRARLEKGLMLGRRRERKRE